MRQKFIAHAFNIASITLIETINSILEEYKKMGYKLSLRQLYYQLVARDFIENTVRSYKRTGDLVSNARLAGLVDWEMIEDRGRESVINTHWTSPVEILQSAALGFRLDRWEGQPCYCEVMVEKDALSGILLPVCRELDIRFSANKGYSSSSAMYEAGKRFAAMASDPESVVKAYHLFYLGDHDPSGVDMTRDIEDRLSLFTGDLGVQVHRLALNFEQVQRWNPPENPAKESDSRYAAYAEKFGESSWELDAVEPGELAQLVRTNVLDLIDRTQWTKIAQRETNMKADLARLAVNYDEP